MTGGIRNLPIHFRTSVAVRRSYWPSRKQLPCWISLRAGSIFLPWLPCAWSVGETGGLNRAKRLRQKGWLVGGDWNHGNFPWPSMKSWEWNVIIPTDELTPSFFSEGLAATTNQKVLMWLHGIQCTSGMMDSEGPKRPQRFYSALQIWLYITW